MTVHHIYPPSNMVFMQRFEAQDPDWRRSIMRQLQRRKRVEQTPFEDICMFAGSMFDRVDICKSENIQLNLQREQLQQQLLGIQQTILAGGSGAAKTILSKLTSTGLALDGKSEISSSTASIVAEKNQLEKKVLDLQERIADALKSKSDVVQRVVDLKTELEEKERLNVKLTVTLEDREREISKLRETISELDFKLKTMTDEHLALTLGYKSLEKRHHALKIECDALSSQILAVKREDADRLNAENDRIIQLQRERMRKEIDNNVAELTKAQAIADNFDILDDQDEVVLSLDMSARIPSKVEFSFDGHENETSCVNWYSCSGPRDDFLATGGCDRKVKIWKISDSTNNLVATLLGSNASITSIDVETDALLASSNDFATRVWSINDFKLKRTLTGHSAKVLSAKFLGVPHRVASGSHDRTVKIWDINQGACIRTYFAGSTCYDLVYQNFQVITGHFDSKIRCWDLRVMNDNEPSGQMVLPAKITSLDISKDGMRLLCSLKDNTIKCLDLRRMEVLQTYSDDKFKIADLCRTKFSADGQYIACGSIDGSLFIWDTSSAKIEKILTGNNASVMASCWSPDGKRIASVGKKISIWQ